MTSAALPIPRSDAVRVIGDAVADRTAYVMISPPGRAGDVAELLADLPGWYAYVDNGAVFRTRAAEMVAVVELISPAAAVFVVSKSLSARALGKAIGQEIPADGSQDLIMLQGDGPTSFPTLFVEAIERVDPGYAAAIRAAAIPVWS